MPAPTPQDDRSDEAIRSDLVTAFAERGSVGARGHARRRLAGDVSALLNRTERAEAELSEARAAITRVEALADEWVTKPGVTDEAAYFRRRFAVQLRAAVRGAGGE